MRDFEKNSDHFTTSDWASKDIKVRGFVNDCYPALKEKLTGEEKVDFWKKYIKYMFTRHGKSALKAIEKEDKNSMTEIYDEILESFDDSDLQELFKDFFGDNIEKKVDELLNEVNKWGDQLKDWLDRN
jgi:hypothetical protein